VKGQKMKRPFVNILILVLLLAGLLMVGQQISQAALVSVGNGNCCLADDPNDPEPEPEFLSFGIGQYFNDDPNDPEPEPEFLSFGISQYFSDDPNEPEPEPEAF
jgi:hypothetical protein